MFGARKRHDLAAVALVCLVGSVCLTGCRSHSHSSSPAQLYDQAGLALRKEQPKEAIEACDRGLAQVSFTSDWGWRFRLLKAEAAMDLDDVDASWKLIANGSPAAPELQARQKMLQGNARRRQGDNAGAEALLTQANDIASRVNDAGLLGEIAMYSGVFNLRQKKLKEAEAWFRIAVARAGEAHDEYLAASAMGDIAVLKQDQLSFEEALYWFDQVRLQFTRLGAKASIAAALGDHGWCLYALGDSDGALRELQEAGEQARAAGDVSAQVDREQNVGDILLERGDYDAAAAHYENVLKMSKAASNLSQEFDALANFAELSLKRRDWNKAEEYRRIADGLLPQIPDPDAKVEIAYLGGRILAGRGDSVKAQEMLIGVVHSNANDPHLVLEAHTALADLYEGQQQIPKADAEYRAAIHYMDASSTRLKIQDYQLTYLDRVNRFYRSYVDFLVRNGSAEEALEVADASRARLLTGGTGVSGRSYSSKEFEKAAGALKATLLSYWLTPEHSYLWVVNGKSIELLTLAPGADLQRMVQHYFNFIQQQGDPLASEDPSGRELFRNLVAPATALIPPGSKVIVVPDGVLHSLNFETLPAGENSPHFWIEDATVSVTPSLGFLLEHETKARPSADSLLLIGDPVSPGQDFPRLTHAAGEIHSIAEVFPPAREKVLANQAAQPSSYAASNPGGYSLIHFVAHSLPDKEVPLNSALILSPQNGAFKLSAREIAAVPLNARLVTLSACKGTGIKTYSGEGSVGLAWAFLHAGAENVVASLWDVDDASTSTLMADFYSRLKSGMSPVDALHTVKLERIKQAGIYRKPYYWGVFQVFSGGQA